METTGAIVNEQQILQKKRDTPPKSNIDTKNNGFECFENVQYLVSNMAISGG